ncbi:sterol desaturase family protein [Mesorhizobium sp. M1348]|uniref:sterol desaturase family protein n=1 Tax=unclassified Mesorhizobium TaxID=325217 RepID=UPI0033388FFC
MDDLAFGTRDKRGNWRPSAPLQVGPLLDFPWRFVRVLRWLPAYFLPWNAVFMAVGALLWFYLTPSRETLQTLGWGWVVYLYLRNSALILLLYGALEIRLYLKRAQGNRFKFNGKFPADHPSDVFWVKSQNIDNAIRTFVSGLPIWTAYEVLFLWAWANGWGPWTSFSEHPVWLVAFALVIPLIHEVHFFCIHRLIHIPVLYRWVHSVHHNSINPSPWSSLSMHPVEHLLYWSDSLIHLIVPSHPLLLLYHLQVTGTGAVVGHIGFDKVEAGDGGVDTHAYAHYLHHKYFEVNYADGTLPIDKWLGTWHDGTKQGDEQMKVRFETKRARITAKQQQNS